MKWAPAHCQSGNQWLGYLCTGSLQGHWTPTELEDTGHGTVCVSEMTCGSKYKPVVIFLTLFYHKYPASVTRKKKKLKRTKFREVEEETSTHIKIQTWRRNNRPEVKGHLIESQVTSSSNWQSKREINEEINDRKASSNDWKQISSFNVLHQGAAISRP